MNKLIFIINCSLVVLGVVVEIEILEDSIFMHEKAIAFIFIQVKRDNRRVPLIKLETSNRIHLSTIGTGLHLHDLSVNASCILDKERI